MLGLGAVIVVDVDIVILAPGDDRPISGGFGVAQLECNADSLILTGFHRIGPHLDRATPLSAYPSGICIWTRID